MECETDKQHKLIHESLEEEKKTFQILLLGKIQLEIKWKIELTCTHINTSRSLVSIVKALLVSSTSFLFLPSKSKKFIIRENEKHTWKLHFWQSVNRIK